MSECGAGGSDRCPSKQPNQFECKNGHSWKGVAASCCPYCSTSRVYLITEVGERVPV